MMEAIIDVIERPYTFDGQKVYAYSNLKERITRCIDCENYDPTPDGTTAFCKLLRIETDDEYSDGYYRLEVSPCDFCKWGSVGEPSDGFHGILRFVYDWAFNGMEGCDEPEWTLLFTICNAISGYWKETK